MERVIEIDGPSQNAFMTLSFLLEFAGARPQTHESLLKRSVFYNIHPVLSINHRVLIWSQLKEMIWWIAPKSLKQLKILSGKGNVG